MPKELERDGPRKGKGHEGLWLGVLGTCPWAENNHCRQGTTGRDLWARIWTGAVPCGAAGAAHDTSLWVLTWLPAADVACLPVGKHCV